MPFLDLCKPPKGLPQLFYEAYMFREREKKKVFALLKSYHYFLFAVRRKIPMCIGFVRRPVKFLRSFYSLPTVLSCNDGDDEDLYSCRVWTHIHAATACSRKKGLSGWGWGGGGGSLQKSVFSGLGFIVKCPNGDMWMSGSAKPVQVDVLIACGALGLPETFCVRSGSVCS